MKKMFTFLLSLIMIVGVLFSAVACDRLALGPITQKELLDGKTPKALYGESVNKYKKHKDERVPYTVNVEWTFQNNPMHTVYIDLAYGTDSISYKAAENDGESTLNESVTYIEEKIYIASVYGDKSYYDTDRETADKYINEETKIRYITPALPEHIPSSWFDTLMFTPSADGKYFTVTAKNKKAENHPLYSNFYESGVDCRLYFTPQGILHIVELDNVAIEGQKCNLRFTFSWEFDGNIQNPSVEAEYSYGGEFNYVSSGDGGENDNSDTPVHQHTPGETVIENYNYSYCTEGGSYDEVIYCTDSSCGEEINRKTTVIEAKDHNYDNGFCYDCGAIDMSAHVHIPCDPIVEIYYPNGCTESGLREEFVYCAQEGCNALLEQKTITIEPTGHTEVREDAVEATCTSLGYSEKVYCSTCGEVFVKKSSYPPIGHNYVDAACLNCGDEQNPDDHFVYTLSDDKSYYIFSGIGEYTGTKINVPDTYKGLPVKEIGRSAFMQKYFIVEIILPDSITAIRSGAFHECTSLQKINIPNGMTEIEFGVFAYCSALPEIIIPDSITKIGEYVFWACRGLTDVVLPDGITNLPYYAFAECWKLENIVIPSGITDIDETAFLDCFKLKNVYYKGSVNDWKTVNVDDTADNNKYLLASVCYYLDSEPTVSGRFWHYVDGAPILWPSVNIPTHNHTEADAVIENEVKATCTAGGSYERVVYCSDSNCGAELSRTIVTTDPLGHSFMDGKCERCGEEDPDFVYEGIEYTPNGDGTCYVSGIGTYTDANLIIPEYSPQGWKVVGIGDDAFTYCQTIESVEFPSSVTYIGESAFEFTPLHHITIPDHITSVGAYAFNCCPKLESVVIGNGLTYIDTCAFGSCQGLLTVTIGSSVSDAQFEAFRGSSIVEVINYSSIDLTAGHWACGEVAMEAIEVHSGASKIKRVGDFAFYVTENEIYLIKYYGESTSVTLPSDYEGKAYYIYKTAFIQSSKLTSITLPDSLLGFVGNPFSYCGNLEYNQYAGLNYIGSANNPYAVIYNVTDKSLTDYVIHSDTKIIFNWAFFNCGNLQRIFFEGSEAEWNNVNVYEGNGPISDDALYFYSKTEPTATGNFWRYVDGKPTMWDEYVAPAPSYSVGLEYSYGENGVCSVIGIGSCTDAHIIIPETYDGYTVVSIDNGWESVFTGDFIISITMPDTIKYIGMFAICCPNLENVSLGADLQHIDEMGFLGCTSLKEITLPANASIGGRAFDGCTSLERFYVSEGNPYYTTIDGNLYDKQGATLIQYACGKSDKTFILPEGVTMIDHYAMSEAKNLEHIVLTDGLTTIGTAAFAGCKSLETVIIPKSVTSIGVFNQEFASSGPLYFLYSCESIMAVYYEGTEEEWDLIKKDDIWDTTDYTANLRSYYSETQPTTSGSFWHYVNDTPTRWPTVAY